MPLELHDTIAAVASPSDPAPRGIVRISGERTVDVVAQVFQTTASDSNSEDWQRSRMPVRIEGHIALPTIGTPLPAALMLWPTARSYTGQPMAEIHTIGAPPLLGAVLERLFECGARSANRGEFTMRAFLAGRIDLVQAEAVLGVIDAADHEELKTALTQLGGGITSKLAAVRNEILSLLGDLEAGLDFVEEDIEFISASQICGRLQVCLGTLQELANDSGTRLPSGHRRRIVLAGLPNAGKSTLFNRLIGSSKAIVSPIAGTTRDYLTSIRPIGRLQVEIIDTAGWETASDLIMQQAQNHRTEQMQTCDLVVWCTAADLSPDSLRENDQLRSQIGNDHITVLEVTTRSDLVNGQPDAALRISVTTGSGIDDLLSSIQQLLETDQGTRSELLSTTAARCRDSLQRSLTSITSAISAAEHNAGDEITAFELRTTLHQIGTILGEVYTDDILDHIFSNFCIGK
jgi:tRNA modification GTPase